MAAMAQEYTEYLAATVLNEQQYVSRPIETANPRANRPQVNYRMLSRALKVHSNLAKQ